MSKAEAITGAVILGLLLSWGLVAWGAADGLWYLTTAQRERLDRFMQSAPPSVMAAQQEDQPRGEPDHPKDAKGPHCHNGIGTPPEHKCDCKKVPIDLEGNGCEVEDTKCKEYCHKDHCTCVHEGCTS